MMASTSSINSNSSGSQAPNPPPRTLSRPNQPPPPPPLPSVPPVPPTRDSSMIISKSVLIKNSASPQAVIPAINMQLEVRPGSKFLAQFESLFKPLEELPLPNCY